MDNAKILSRLSKVIAARKGADASKSYVASLFQKGRKKIAQKVGEEGVELSLAAVMDDREDAISESADLLFHMMILWADMDISPDDIFEKLAKREGISGIDEKNAR
ncbi:MAG: phosphoribosyl-ATP diphosphatase [Emcibacter sp.]|nr:phosphoribosyl-ATP diphosphatase [Emcibacter sp.]